MNHLNKSNKFYFQTSMTFIFAFFIPSPANSQFNNNVYIQALESCEFSYTVVREAYPELYNQGYSRCMRTGNSGDKSHCNQAAVAYACGTIAADLAFSYASPVPSESTVIYCKNLPAQRGSYFENREFQIYAAQVQNCRDMGIMIQ